MNKKELWINDILGQFGQSTEKQLLMDIAEHTFHRCQEAKKEVIDDIDEFVKKFDFWMEGSKIDIEYKKMKQHHLSTFQKKSDIINDKTRTRKL